MNSLKTKLATAAAAVVVDDDKINIVGLFHIYNDMTRPHKKRETIDKCTN